MNKIVNTLKYIFYAQEEFIKYSEIVLQVTFYEVIMFPAILIFMCNKT